MEEITIDGRPIGAAHPPYIIAELSGNHNGEIERALALIDAAKDAGADAVKLQTYTADTITIDHDGPEFTIQGGLWDGRTLYELYGEASTPWEWHATLFEHAKRRDITIFSSPFDDSAVDLLESLDAPAYKIASFEAIDLGLIEKVASTGKPIIISTGMTNLEEVELAVSVAKRSGSGQIALLHCISGYPTPPQESNLRTICDLANRFDTVIGLSDHTLGTAVSVAAVALGATVVEKHVTLQRSDGGPDAAFSLEPAELAQLVASASEAWQALGSVNYSRTPSEQGNALFRRSIYVVKDMLKGEQFSSDNIRSIRPGFGLMPKHLKEVYGRKASCSISRATALSWDLIEAD